MIQQQPNIHTVFSVLRGNPELPVILTQNELTVLPGYHITEVKMSVVNSLDCGQGTDQWHELVIQVLDGKASSSAMYMPSKMVMGILDKALKGEPADENTKLYFEFSPGNAALQKSSVSAVEIVNKTIAIALTNSTAQCKPFQRALASGNVSASSEGCCGSASTPSQAASCCT